MEYFAAANTKNGFKSMFESVFADVKRLYILKGSSGCGKSTFMRRVALEAQKLGMHTDLILCSSDPESLDGVIVKELGIGVADGTAPHVMDVKYPCVRESIINFGEFLKENKLLPQAETIISLTDRKALHYKKAYRALSAAGKVGEMLAENEAAGIDRGLLEEHAFRLVEKIGGKKRNGKIKGICTAAFGSEGLVVKPTFGSVKRVYTATGRGAEGYVSAVLSIAREQGVDIIASFDPVDLQKPDSVYFEETATLLTFRRQSPCSIADSERKINTAKFESPSAEALKAKHRLLKETEKALLAEAASEFARARALHSAIESIYIPAMDFNAVDEYTDNFCARVVHI